MPPLFRLVATLGLCLTSATAGSVPATPVTPPPVTIDVDTMVGRAGAGGGVPHFDQIIEVAVDHTATRALTVDAMGEVRLWPALDGAHEPQRVPVLEPRALAIAARGAGSVVAIVDRAGALQLFGFDAAGLSSTGRPTATLVAPPDRGFVQVVATGERFVAQRDDGVFVLIDANGKQLATAAIPRGHAIVGEHATGGAVAVLTTSGGKSSLHVLAAERTSLRWRRTPIALPAAHLAGGQPALAPDHRHAAYLAADRTPMSVALDTGVARPFASGERGFTVGFAAADTVQLDVDGVIYQAPIGGRWRKTGDGTTLHPVFAAGRAISPATANLLVVERDGRSRHLGYQEAVHHVSASADGRTAAWPGMAWPNTKRDTLVVREVDSGRETRIPSPRGRARQVTVIDRDRVTAIYDGGTLAVFDVRTGKELQALDLGAVAAHYVPPANALVVETSRAQVDVIPLSSSAAAPLAPLGTALPVPRGTGGPVVVLDPAKANGDLAAFRAPDGSPVRVALVRTAGGWSTRSSKARLAVRRGARRFGAPLHHHVGRRRRGDRAWSRGPAVRRRSRCHADRRGAAARLDRRAVEGAAASPRARREGGAPAACRRQPPHDRDRPDPRRACALARDVARRLVRRVPHVGRLARVRRRTARHAGRRRRDRPRARAPRR